MISLAAPTYLLSRAIEDLLAGAPTSRLAAWAAAVLAAGIVSAWLAISRHRTMSQLRIGGSYLLNRVLVRHAVELGASLTRRAGAGQLVTIGLGDVAGASTSLTVTGPGVGAVVAYVVIGVLLWSVSGTLALVVLLGVPVLVVVVGPVMGRVIESQDSYRTAEGDLTAQLVDAMAGLRVLNAFGGKERYRRRFGRTSDQLLSRGYRVATVLSWVNAAAVGLPAVFLATVTWLSARMVVDGEISAGEMVAVYGYTAALVAPVTALIEGGDMLGRGVVAARRIIAFLELQPLETGRGAGPVLPLEHQTLRDVGTGIEVPPGSFVGIVSDAAPTATQLLGRLGRIDHGPVQWGEVLLPEQSSSELRRRILLADTDAEIFAGTVGTIVRGPRTDATDAEVADALHVAAAADVLTSVGGGLDAWVEAGGANISGGQRQRLRLARAVLQRPEILLAADPTSALDAHTETLVAERLRESRVGLQTVVATTSPLVLAQADLVYLLVEGRLRAAGTHVQLAQTPEYQNLVLRGVTTPEGAGA
jgi:ABC-type multidrug transport system fused ATPase/permease subunit